MASIEKGRPPEKCKAIGVLVQKNEGEGAPVFRITSAVLDRHKDRVKDGALKVDAFLRNPVLLWNHDDQRPAIGIAKVFEESGQWLMEPQFDEEDAVAAEIARKVRKKYLRTCSIRFRPLKWVFNEEGGVDYEEVELLEVSITNVPANEEAERVKNSQNEKAASEEADKKKMMETGDIDAIRAIVKEELAPVIKLLVELSDALGMEDDAEDDEADKSEEMEAEMTEEEEEELKAWAKNK
jgi:HK97 family phage prohead protease